MLINNVDNKTEINSLIISELRDNYGIKYRKEKKHKQSQDKGYRRKIFNVPLHQLELTDVILANGGISQVPLFVSDACQRILEQVSTEGLFRKAGSAVRQREIRAHLESGIRLSQNHQVIDVANILKTFFRELPEPLLPPGNMQESILRCLLCGERKVNALLTICLLLPPLSLNTLAFFMQFLKTVSLHADINKMTIENLAIIFAPGVMPISEIIGQRLNCHVKIIQMLIQQANEIAVIPKTILDKVQRQVMPIAPETEKKKKKRRSGSLTRMFNGLRKIVGALGSSESLDKTPELNQMTPCLSKSAKKRKVLEANAFSTKKKKDVLALLPDNGGILPCTPICTKEPKKTRLSLGSRRHNKQNNNVLPLVNITPMERRWSVVGTGWNKKKLQTIEDIPQENIKSLSPVISLPCLASDVDSTIVKINTPHNNVTPIESNETTISSNDYDFVRISKSEYEAIKERVSAIETRISQEFNNVHASMLSSSDNDVDNIINGPAKVLDKYEKTLEETEQMNASSTDQLAKRLSRDLKIRRSAEHKVLRSPSARKIGTIRRRSKENLRLSRNQSWHLGNKRSSSEFAADSNAPISLDLSFYPKVNLKRGRPNTVQSGLRHPSPCKKNSSDCMLISLSDKNILSDALQNEKWMNAENFFYSLDDKQRQGNSNTKSIESSQPPRRLSNRLSLKLEEPPSTVRFVSQLTIGEMKTPMLPPRLPVKKTPLNSVKTPMLPPTFVNKTLLTPVQDHNTGRASIARLRSQNAGMVAAKAKLFDGMVTDTTNIHPIKNYQISRSDSARYILTKPAMCSNGSVSNKEVPNHVVHQIKNSHRHKSNNSPRRSTPRRRNIGKSPKGIQRRQKLRLVKSPGKNSPRNLQKILMNDISNGSMLLGQSINDDKKMPLNGLRDDVKTMLNETCSPNVNMFNNCNQPTSQTTPHIKRPLIIKSPRRILKTPGRDEKKNSPMRATPIKLRCSPRLQLLRNSAMTKS